MKTKEELNALKEEAETVSRKPHALTDDELEQVFGGIADGMQMSSEAKPVEER